MKKLDVKEYEWTEEDTEAVRKDSYFAAAPEESFGSFRIRVWDEGGERWAAVPAETLEWVAEEAWAFLEERCVPSRGTPALQAYWMLRQLRA